jgi:two-component system, OmpR family, copper resistance phosphate regulon response regulator CusR
MKILVVEDEQKIARYIKKGLEFSAHVVDVAYDGLTGYEMASAESYDVIVLDRMLPELSGMEVCLRLRKEKNVTPILLLTAKSLLDDKVAGLDAGADDYLTKPFEFAELVARINALGRRPRTIRPKLLQAGTLELSTHTSMATRAGKKLQLSKKEFALLEFLLKNANQVFTKEQLAERVWEYDSDVLGNTVQVYIGYLRAKIDTQFPTEKALIRTVRGFGYTVRST